MIGETSCEKLPVEICGAGCSYEEGEEECHDTTIATVVDVPEEVCDLNPQKVIFLHVLHQMIEKTPFSSDLEFIRKVS